MSQSRSVVCHGSQNIFGSHTLSEIYTKQKYIYVMRYLHFWMAKTPLILYYKLF